MDAMWQEYGMEELEKGMQKLFPASRISVAELMGQLLQGDVLGAAGTLLQEVIQGMGASAAGRKNILIWLIVLGILSALLIHFVEVFDKHQIADLSFYFIYLLMDQTEITLAQYQGYIFRWCVGIFVIFMVMGLALGYLPVL